MEVIEVCYQKYNTISGRASRSEFWLFNLYWLPFHFCAWMMYHRYEVYIQYYEYLKYVFFGVYFFAFVVPAWCVMNRRLHDINKDLIYIVRTIVKSVLCVLTGLFLFAYVALPGVIDFHVIESAQDNIIYTACLTALTISIWLLSKQGDVGDNQYGQDPLYIFSNRCNGQVIEGVDMPRSTKYKANEVVYHQYSRRHR